MGKYIYDLDSDIERDFTDFVSNLQLPDEDWRKELVQEYIEYRTKSKRCKKFLGNHGGSLLDPRARALLVVQNKLMDLLGDIVVLRLDN